MKQCFVPVLLLFISFFSLNASAIEPDNPHDTEPLTVSDLFPDTTSEMLNVCGNLFISSVTSVDSSDDTKKHSVDWFFIWANARLWSEENPWPIRPFLQYARINDYQASYTNLSKRLGKQTVLGGLGFDSVLMLSAAIEETMTDTVHAIASKILKEQCFILPEQLKAAKNRLQARARQTGDHDQRLISLFNFITIIHNAGFNPKLRNSYSDLLRSADSQCTVIEGQDFSGLYNRCQNKPRLLLNTLRTLLQAGQRNSPRQSHGALKPEFKLLQDYSAYVGDLATDEELQALWEFIHINPFDEGHLYGGPHCQDSKPTNLS